MMCRAPIPLRESVPSTASKPTPSSMLLVNDDFFCRFEYNSSSGAFNLDRVAVYCKCEMPYNPDDLMVQCEDCSDWFHPHCIDITPEEAKRLEHFFCQSCSSEDQKKLNGSHNASRHPETKVDTKRRRR